MIRVPRAISRALEATLRHRRWARSPLALYDLGLGGLLGRGLLRLEHRGRRSGRSRYAVLEVVDRPRPGVIRVVSGLGRGAQWFRNLQADPRVRVTNGWGPPVAGTAHVLDEAEAAATFARYQAVHPVRWAALERTVSGHLTPGETLVGSVPVLDLVLDTVPGNGTSRCRRPRRPGRAGR